MGPLLITLFLGVLIVGAAVVVFAPSAGSGLRSDLNAQNEADREMQSEFNGRRHVVTYDVREHQVCPSRGELIHKAHAMGYRLKGSSGSNGTSTLVFKRR